MTLADVIWYAEQSFTCRLGYPSSGINGPAGQGGKLESLARQYATPAHRAKGKKRTFATGAVQIEIVAYPSIPKRG